MGRWSELREDLDGIKYYDPLLKRRFVEILLNELLILDPPEIHIYDIYRFLNKFSPVYFDVINQKFDSLNKLESILDDFYCLESILKPIFFNSLDKLYKTKFSWDYELDIQPIARYLRIADKIPFDYPTNLDYLKRERYSKLTDAQFDKIKQEFNSLLLERDNCNLMSVGIGFSYANIMLPKTYDIIFDCRDVTKFWEQKVIVKYAFNFRTVFHADLWRGHHSHCIIEIIGDIPAIFEELPINGNGEHKGIGLCTKYDWQYIRNDKQHY